VENRIRLLVEVTQALISVAGAGRTGVRLSPNDDPQGCGDSESETLFTNAVHALDQLLDYQRYGSRSVRQPLLMDGICPLAAGTARTDMPTGPDFAPPNSRRARIGVRRPHVERTYH